jgi:hypothetical protein
MPSMELLSSRQLLGTFWFGTVARILEQRRVAVVVAGGAESVPEHEADIRIPGQPSWAWSS